jgi:hypothetical protein
MTFTAVLCVALVYVVIKYANELAPNGLPSLLKIPLAILVGVGVVFLVGESAWAHDQEFMGKTLDVINGYSKVICGVLLGAAAVGVDTTLKTVRNVGANDTPPQP